MEKAKRYAMMGLAILSLAFCVLNTALTVRAVDGFIANAWEEQVGQNIEKLARR